MSRNQKPQATEKPTLNSHSLADDRIAFLFITLASFIFYVYHLAPGVTAEDSGDFIMAAKFFGNAHPPGYPLYVLIAGAFARIWPGDFAYAVNLTSAFAAALSAGFLFLIIRTILQANILISAISSMAYALHILVWSQAVIAEVYALNACLLALFIWLTLRAKTTDSPRLIYLMLFVFGLGLSNHYPLMILAGLPFLPFRKLLKLSSQQKIIASVTLLAGLLPYVLLVINAFYRSPEYNFAFATDWPSIWQHITRKLYSDIDNSGAPIVDRATRVAHSLVYMARGYLFFAPLVLFSAYKQIRTRDMRLLPFHLSLALCWLFLGLYLQLNASDENITLFNAFLSPAIMLISVSVAEALQKIQINNKVLLSAAAVAISVQIYFGAPYASHRNDVLIKNWANRVLNSFEPNSNVILCSSDTFALYYQQLIENVRPDLKLYDRYSAITKENLYAPFRVFQVPDGARYRETKEKELIQNQQQVTYFMCEEPFKEYKTRYRLDTYAYRALRSFEFESQYRALSADDLLFFKELAEQIRSQDHWRHRKVTATTFHMLRSLSSEAASQIEELLDIIRKSGLYDIHDYTYEVASEMARKKMYSQASEFYSRAEFTGHKMDAHDYSNMCGIEIFIQNFERAVELCEKSVGMRTACSKATYTNLALAYQKLGRNEEHTKYVQLANECQ